MNVLRSSAAILAALSLAAILPANPAQADTNFAARAPRACAPIKNKPTVEQAAALIQCHQEQVSSRDLVLLEKVQVQMGGSQPYNFKAHSYLTAIDTTSLVYPIRGSFVMYDCSAVAVIPVIHSDNRGKNCFTVTKSTASGFCWKTTFGSWDCAMTDTDHNDPVEDQAPPRP